MNQFLNRGDAPFGDDVWDLIDKTVTSVASQALCGRRLLSLEGPYGLGVKSISMHDEKFSEESGDNITLISAKSVPLSLISSNFTLDGRDLDLFTSSGVLFDMKDLVSSVLVCAQKEDNLIFNGSKALGLSGLNNSNGVLSSKLKPWKQIGDAAESVIEGIDQLDKAGFHGPYTLALAPKLYNSLFKRYPQEEVLEIEHLNALVSDGIIKAPVLQDGGVLVAYGAQFASIALGQDLMTAFEGPSGREYVFVVSESIALRVNVPESICVLKPA